MSFFNKLIKGFVGTVVVDVFLLVLSSVITTQKEVIEDVTLYVLLSAIVPLMTLLAFKNDFEELQNGSVAIFIGSMIGTLFSGYYLV